MKNPLLWSLSLGMVLCSAVGVCWAEEPGAQSAAPEAESAPPKTEGVAPKVNEAPKPVESAAPTPVEKCCPAPVAPPKKPPCPVYVSDLERLAALTASDPVVFERADSLASRDNYARRLLLPFGLVIGGGLILAGTLDRLSNDQWTNGSKWTVFSGPSVVVVTLLIYLALAPDRDDLLTVINHWNLRHPERPLAP